MDEFKIAPNQIDTIEHGLRALVNIQYQVSGHKPESLDGGKQALTNAMYALNEEVHELGRELHWKPWKGEGEHIDHTAALKEASDILAFFALVMINTSVRMGYTDPSKFIQHLVYFYESTSYNNVSRFEASRR